MYEHVTYSNDLSDNEWKILEPLIPVYNRGARRKVNMRNILRGFDIGKKIKDRIIGYALNRFIRFKIPYRYV